MFELLQMWALIEVLGLMCLPLTTSIFHNLPDRGWAFSKAIGVALLTFCVWLPLMVFHALFFSQAFIFGVLLVLLASNLAGLIRTRHEIVKLVRANLIYIVATECVFLGMMFLLGWIRSYGPDIRSFEMFMDEGFIAAIMRSPHLPPNDMWFAGYSINYYYYAHFAAAVLGKLLGQAPAVLFNTGISMFFGLTAVSLFGVTCNIVAWARHLRAGRYLTGSATTERPDTTHPSLLGGIPYGVITMLMAVVLGNLAATQEWFKVHGDAMQFDWFGPSRVVDKTINEFPAFSFLLSCFHAHVLALAFTIVAIALALNLFLEHDAKGIFVFGRGWRLPLTLGTSALILGGLFTMNGWDFPTYLGLTLVCIALQQWMAHGSRFSIDLVLDVFIAGANITALSFLLYTPFYLNFISPAQGIGLVGPADRSQLNSEVLIYGTFTFVFLSLLLASALKRRLPSERNEPENGVRVPRIGMICLVLIIGAELGALVFMRNSATFVAAGSITLLGVMSILLYHLHDRPRSFTLLLGTVAFALVAFCEVVFLKDVFADNYPRMNTVFKLYFQAWALLSVCCGAGLYFIVESFRLGEMLSSVQGWLQRFVGVLWTAVFLALLLAGAVYPLAGTYARTNHYAQRTNSLDGLAYMQYYDPADYYAIVWLNTHVSGDPVIIEAVGPDYSDYAHVSAFTGLPTPMGWEGHEYQWRVNWLNAGQNSVEFARRGGDVDTIYTDPDPNIVKALLARYHAQYLYVGPLEEAKYPRADLHRFSSFLTVVYSFEGVTIYKVS